MAGIELKVNGTVRRVDIEEQESLLTGQLATLRRISSSPSAVRKVPPNGWRRTIASTPSSKPQ